MIHSLRNVRLYRDRANNTKLLLYFNTTLARDAFIDDLAMNATRADKVQLDGFTLLHTHESGYYRRCDTSDGELRVEKVGLNHDFYGWKSEDYWRDSLVTWVCAIRTRDMWVRHYHHVEPAPGHDFYGWRSQDCEACGCYTVYAGPSQFKHNGSPDAWK